MSGAPAVVELYSRSVEKFRAVVEQVPDQAWAAPTPCADWDVRALVNHVVSEDRWVVPLLEGKTVADVGDALDGDLLGESPADAAASAAKSAVAALAEPGATARTVHLSFGDFSAEEYAWQVLADHVVHTWDLAVAIGAPRELEPRLVEVTAGWWEAWEDTYRGAGAVGPTVALPESASRQDRLVASFGRDPTWTRPGPG
jgi:uncharacterized protein (TIGR03086 family)